MQVDNKWPRVFLTYSVSLQLIQILIAKYNFGNVIGERASYCQVCSIENRDIYMYI